MAKQIGAGVQVDTSYAQTCEPIKRRELCHTLR